MRPEPGFDFAAELEAFHVAAERTARTSSSASSAPKTGAASAFIVGTRSNDSSFVSRARRVNAVLRWEYRGGSALYLVWQQTRDGGNLLDDGEYSSRLDNVLDEPSKNVLYLKASYRLGR